MCIRDSNNSLSIPNSNNNSRGGPPLNNPAKPANSGGFKNNSRPQPNSRDPYYDQGRPNNGDFHGDHEYGYPEDNDYSNSNYDNPRSYASPSQPSRNRPPSGGSRPMHKPPPYNEYGDEEDPSFNPPSITNPTAYDNRTTYMGSPKVPSPIRYDTSKMDRPPTVKTYKTEEEDKAPPMVNTRSLAPATRATISADVEGLVYLKEKKPYFAGKHVIIAGGLDTVGKSLAFWLLNMGSFVAVLVRAPSEQKRRQEVQEELEREYKDFIYESRFGAFLCDYTSEAALRLYRRNAM
eukprot:TRINITY_DN3334_c0_g1_i5.p1 TRINITY_DN3334_c0_g1~~TRINITY_DN3334_c0_g1_i5.p1  ORF type:complete len:322 (+),score=62.23 TRINITY_DN3334_c0_g1_i5:91-966(+)